MTNYGHEWARMDAHDFCDVVTGFGAVRLEKVGRYPRPSEEGAAMPSPGANRVKWLTALYRRIGHPEDNWYVPQSQEMPGHDERIAAHAQRVHAEMIALGLRNNATAADRNPNRGGYRDGQTTMDGPDNADKEELAATANGAGAVDESPTPENAACRRSVRHAANPSGWGW